MGKLETLIHLYTFLRGKPDFTVGSEAGNRVPYLERWFILPQNKLFNIYLHKFSRSDDDRALHDHPWFNMSILLVGTYREHTIKNGGVHHYVRRTAGTLSGFKLRSPWSAHRIQLDIVDGVETPCWTLFLRGPTQRVWGFHCHKRWIPYTEFVKEVSGGNDIGTGCGDAQ